LPCPWLAHAATFVEGPCSYAGVDGEREATMIFTVDPWWPDCAKQIPFSEATTRSEVNECGVEQIHPTGFIVAQDNEGMINVFSPLYDAINQVLNDGTFFVEEIWDEKNG
jgi:hypothetical protein